MSKKIDIKKMTYLAILTAIVVVLQFIPIKIATFELALSVPVIVVGAALCGVGAGAWLGFVFGAVVIAKGCLAGLVSALIYKLSEKINRYFAVVTAAAAATFVNTGVFLIGSLIFFDGNIAVVIGTFISINFLIEIAVNMILVPVVYRIINIKKKA